MTLEEYLNTENLTNVAFAKSVGVTDVCIGHYIKKRRTPRKATIEKIMEVTNGAVTPNDFFTEGTC